MENKDLEPDESNIRCGKMNGWNSNHAIVLDHVDKNDVDIKYNIASGMRT